MDWLSLCFADDVVTVLSFLTWMILPIIESIVLRSQGLLRSGACYKCNGFSENKIKVARNKDYAFKETSLIVLIWFLNSKIWNMKTMEYYWNYYWEFLERKWKLGNWQPAKSRLQSKGGIKIKQNWERCMGSKYEIIEKHFSYLKYLRLKSRDEMGNKI